MMQPKPIPPSMRPKSRYVVFEIISERPIDFSGFGTSAWAGILGFLGELTASESRMWIMRSLYNEKAQRGVLKCAHDRVEHVRAALTLVNMIGETRAIIRILGVTGTIKSARNKYLGMTDLRAFETA